MKDALIFDYILLNIALPTYLLAMGSLEKKWHVIFAYLFPVGSVFLILIDGLPYMVRGLKEEFKKLK